MLTGLTSDANLAPSRLTLAVFCLIKWAREDPYSPRQKFLALLRGHFRLGDK